MRVAQKITCVKFVALRLPSICGTHDWCVWQCGGSGVERFGVRLYEWAAQTDADVNCKLPNCVSVRNMYLLQQVTEGQTWPGWNPLWTQAADRQAWNIIQLYLPRGRWKHQPWWELTHFWRQTDHSRSWQKLFSTLSFHVNVILNLCSVHVKAVLNWAWTRCSWAALSVGNIQACGLVLKWCFRSWRAAVFKAHGHALGCSKCCQRRIWEQASDWLNSFVTEMKKQKRG